MINATQRDASGPCRYGMIGAGRIAQKFADTFRSGLVSNSVLSAVASTDEKRAAEFAASHGIARSYGSYAALLGDPGIDLVYVAVTNNAHFQCCMDAIAAGKHVLCEKPLALTGQEAAELIYAAKAKGVFLMEAMWSRFLPATRKAAQWAADGHIGNLRCISASFCAARDPGDYQRLYDPGMGGGAFYDLGVYAFSLVQYLAKGRKLIQAFPLSVPAGTGVDASTFVHLQYDDGLVGEIKCSIQFHACNEAWIYGDRGYIRIAPYFHCAQKVELFTGPLPGPRDYKAEPAETFLHPVQSGFEFEIEHAAACVLEGKPESPVMPLSDTLETARLFDLIQGRQFFSYSDATDSSDVL
ncbi:MAG: Gfo/Idh/MocA family oxidoreductase [Ruminococcaceae bacterium]|nr:Gfo/Idh/MocA family oxidoreductase [Oscillospiraceae bacterium]